MDPTNSTEQTKKSLTSNQKLVIGGLIVALLVSILAGLIYWWRPPRTDPPPIIVKSGSFDLEAYADVNIQNGTGTNPDIIEYPAFPATHVIVHRYNKDDSSLYTQYQGPIQIIKIWMEEPRVTMATNPTFIMELSGTTFKLTSTEKLKKGPNNHTNRAFKIKDKDHKDFRFGKIQIGTDPERVTMDGEEFFIRFYRP